MKLLALTLTIIEMLNGLYVFGVGLVSWLLTVLLQHKSVFTQSHTNSKVVSV